MGVLHAGIINSLNGAEVTAICETEHYLAKFSQRFLPKTVTFYRDHLRMAEDEELDGVLITTPIGSHTQLITDFAKLNKNLSIFVEKPLAASSQEARRACDAVANTRGVQMVGYQKRFSPIFRKAREVIKSGVLGDPIFYRAYSVSSDVLREGKSWRFRKETGGVLLDLAPHLLDILLWFFGEPMVIKSLARHVYSSEVEDYVHAVMSYESGMMGHLDACWSMREYRLPEISIELHGKLGKLTVSDDSVRIAPNENSRTQKPVESFYKQSFNTSVPFLLADPEYTSEDEAFLHSIKTKEIPESNFAEAAKVNAIIDRIRQNNE